jgi:hypothetical protein
MVHFTKIMQNKVAYPSKFDLVGFSRPTAPLLESVIRWVFFAQMTRTSRSSLTFLLSCERRSCEIR